MNDLRRQEIEMMLEYISPQGEHTTIPIFEHDLKEVLMDILMDDIKEGLGKRGYKVDDEKWLRHIIKEFI